MAFSSFLTACFILLAFMSQMRASVVRTSDLGLGEKTENFNLRITEKETNFDEQVEIDEDNDIEYFTVPAHNDVLAADFVFDFKMNITLTRFKDRGICFLTPLPSELPKPNLLKTGLREVAALPADHQIKTVTHKWKINAKIDKTTLRREVRGFCGHYPVYRLHEYTPDANAGHLGERAKRQITFDEFDLCGQSRPPCSWTAWKLRCKFTTSHCVYYLKCRQNVKLKVNICDKNAVHESGTIMCCEARCSK